MKAWPKDRNKPFPSAEDLLKPLMVVYRKVMKNPEKDHKYAGFDIGQKEKVCTPSLESIGMKENLEYHAERDRDVHDVFLFAAFQLGIEQGRRMEREYQDPFLTSIELKIERLKNKKEMPKDVLEFYLDDMEESMKLLKGQFS